MAGGNEQDRVVPDEERARQILEQLKSVHAFDLAYETMVGLVNFGSQKMGLLEETREVRDLDDARLSIELVRAILEVLERERGDERTSGLHDALAQMQLAYAHAVQLANAERAAEREGRPASEAPPAADGAKAPASEGAAAARADAPAHQPEAPAGEAERGREEPDGEAAPAAAVEGEATAKEKPARKPAAKKKPAAGKAAPKKKPAPRRPPAGED